MICVDGCGGIVLRLEEKYGLDSRIHNYHNVLVCSGKKRETHAVSWDCPIVPIGITFVRKQVTRLNHPNILRTEGFHQKTHGNSQLVSRISTFRRY